MITITTKLSVKELAGPVGKSVSFIYKARMAGLPMEWDEETRCLVSTPAKVKRWIKRNRFKLLDGKPKPAKKDLATEEPRTQR